MTPQQSETMASPADAARQARSDARRRQLLDAGARLMERSGSHSVSMQSVADEAGVSVGLIYRYFANKQDLVQGVIVGVLDDMARLLPEAVGPETDPVRRIAAAFTAYCRIVDASRSAVLLTYRESNTLDEDGRRLIKDLEVQTAQPLTEAIQDAVGAELLRPVDVQLLSYDLLMIAHSWALKHWYYAPLGDLATFSSNQLGLILSGALSPERRSAYADLLGHLA